MHPVVRIRFFTDEKCFGPGIAQLLEEIRQEMSLRKAACAMGMTRKPFMVASSALKGSTSVTITSAPMPLARSAIPLPHQP